MPSPSPHPHQELSPSTVEHSGTATTKKPRKKKKTQVEGEQSPTTAPTAQVEDPTETTTATEGSLSPLTPTRNVKKKTKDSPTIHPTLSDDAFHDEPTSMATGAARSGTPNTPTKRKKKKKQQRPVQLESVEDSLHESFQIVGLVAYEPEPKEPKSMVQNHNHSDSRLRASDRHIEAHNDKDNEKSKSKSNIASLNQAMNHPRRDPMVQRKQRQRNAPPSLQQHPGAYTMTTPQSQPEAMALSTGAGVARHRQMRKDHKQQQELPTNTGISTSVMTTLGPSTTASVSTKSGLRKKASLRTNDMQWKPPEGSDGNASRTRRQNTDLLQHPPPPPPYPPQTENRRVSNLQPPPTMHDSSLDLVSAQLVTEFDDNDNGDGPRRSRDSIYLQAREDATREVREDLLRDVLVAEEVVDEEQVKQRQCRKWTAMSLCAVIVVAILAGVLGAQPWKEDNGSISSPAPVNDLCTGALALTLEEARILGDTTGASPVNFDSCTSSVQPGGLGVWYSIKGTGGPIRVSTCDSNVTESYDTQITLFQGTCESHVCVDANDNGQDDSCGVFSSITWPSVLGETYILCVHGKFAATNDVQEDIFVPVEDTSSTVEGTPISGTFQLTVEETADNDFCETATLLEMPVEGSRPVTVTGTTQDATSDKQVSFCHGTESTAPGVWYRVVGTDKPLLASLTNATTNLQLTVYEGKPDFANSPRDDCRSMRCIAGYDNPFDYRSQATFSTNSGVSYYVLVHGVDGQRGSFELRVSETVENDLCEAATPVSLDDGTVPSTRPNSSTFLSGAFGQEEQQGVLQTVIEGSTALATLSGRTQAGASCDGVVATGVGVWYILQGTGETMLAFTCNNDGVARDSLVDTTLMVFRGDNCRDLQCVAGDDDSVCGLHSFVEWESEQDETYFLLVSGKLDARGSFQLSIESLPPGE